MRSNQNWTSGDGVAVATMTPAFADEAADIAAIKASMAALGEAFDSRQCRCDPGDDDADHRAVTFVYKGPQTVDEQLASLPELKFETYDALPPTVAMLGPDAALVTWNSPIAGRSRATPLPQRASSARSGCASTASGWRSSIRKPSWSWSRSGTR